MYTRKRTSFTPCMQGTWVERHAIFLLHFSQRPIPLRLRLVHTFFFCLRPRGFLSKISQQPLLFFFSWSWGKRMNKRPRGEEEGTYGECSIKTINKYLTYIEPFTYKHPRGIPYSSDLLHRGCCHACSFFLYYRNKPEMSNLVVLY